jgi:hypothetical protein
MTLFSQDESERMFRAINGEHARRAAGWVVIQDAGATDDGRPIYCVVGVMVGEFRHAEGMDCTHEMVHGEMTIRPQKAFAGNKYRGAGAAAILTSDAFNAENWEKRLL